jgi:hypothetical protein
VLFSALPFYLAGDFMNCLSDETLVDLTDWDEMTPNDLEPAETHLKVCASCRRRLQEFVGFIGRMEDILGRGQRGKRLLREVRAERDARRHLSGLLKLAKKAVN